MSLCINCNVAETVAELPAGGGDFTADQMYCEDCLKEEIASGRLNPIQVPIPKDPRNND